MNDIILENRHFTLTVGEDCIVKSLTLKYNGEECLKGDEEIALFSVTQDRPFNNEVKLAHPNKRTTFQANRLRMEGDTLIAGFEITPFEAVISVKSTDSYISFTLKAFIVHPEDYPGLNMSPPPVAELRLIQLPVKKRKCFGEWLNVSHDETGAVNVLATSPYPRIDSDRRRDYRIMYADVCRDIKLLNAGAAVIACNPDSLLDCIDTLEKDFGLPRGVESRRSDTINASIYWTANLTPANADEHIRYAKQGGFRMILSYYTSFIKEEHGYGYNGNYDFNDSYPNGIEDLKKVIEKIKAAGITPGIHFLQTHIGLWSRYVTPIADHRLNLTRRFTLARSLSEDDTVIYVEQNPEGTVMADRCRILKLGGELISYESYTTEPPYMFTGCERGVYSTDICAHPTGLSGGILDISEFGAVSCYIDQNSSLQDEIADKIAKLYNAGFSFVYFDGSEGTNAPFEFHVPNAQYRVYKKFGKAPLFTEGAAKAHFSWHFLSGGNAFDVFGPPIFKKMIDKYPAEEAPRMRQDFTRLNFGWWRFWNSGTQPDMYEYGTSRAAAWDCPATIQFDLSSLDGHPRTADILEVLRRWEDVRSKKWLTDSQKEELRRLGKEHILLINEEGEYELVPYEQIMTSDEDKIRAFIFERRGLSYIVYWHTCGCAKLTLKLSGNDVSVTDTLGGERIPTEESENGIVIPADGRRYLYSSLPPEILKSAFANMTVSE